MKNELIPPKIKDFSFNLLSALVITLHLLVLASAYANLIFAGELSSFLPIGMISLFIGSIIFLLGTACFCPLPLAISRIQDEQIPIIILMTMSIASSIHIETELLSTILMAIGLSTVITGVSFLLISYFNLGKFIRFIPYPVIAGFLAGVGWLLVLISFKQMAGITELSLNNIFTLFKIPAIYSWLPALGFSFIILFATDHFKHRLLLPSLILFGLAGFYFICFIFDVSLETLRVHKILAQANEFTHLDVLTHGISLHAVDWSVLRENLNYFTMIVFMNILSFLLSANGIENSLNCELDLNHELNHSGYQNILAGFVGAPAGFISMSHTILNDKLKTNSRMVGYLCAILFFMAIFFGYKILSFLPTPLLASMIMFLGLSFFRDWGITVRKQLSFLEYLVVLCILFSVVFWGLFEGVAIGVGLSIILFVYNYSTISIIKYTLSGRDIRSSRQYDLNGQALLDKHGAQLIYFKLHEYLFFGSANSIFEQLQKKFSSLIEDGCQRFIIFDFKLVSGIDASFISILKKINNYVHKHNFILILTELSPQHMKHIQANLKSAASKQLLFFNDNDQALEYYEKQILSTYNNYVPKEDKLHHIFPSVDDFFQYLRTVELKKGDILFRQEDISENLFYLVEGELGVYLELNSNERKRIHIINSGNVVGEIGFYLEQPRTA
jgi:SulP family sulfate permease